MFLTDSSLSNDSIIWFISSYIILVDSASEEFSQDKVIRNYTGDSTVHEKMNGSYVEGLEVDGIVFSTNDHILDYPELSFKEFIDEFVLRKPSNWQFENIESLKSKLLDENSLLKVEY